MPRQLIDLAMFSSESQTFPIKHELVFNFASILITCSLGFHHLNAKLLSKCGSELNPEKKYICIKVLDADLIEYSVRTPDSFIIFCLEEKKEQNMAIRIFST